MEGLRKVWVYEGLWSLQATGRTIKKSLVARRGFKNCIHRSFFLGR
jgi:hypothetical protein